MKTWQQIQQQLSRELDLPLEVVVAHTNAYWLNLKSRLRYPTSDMVYLPFIGKFTITPKRLFTLMAHYLMILRGIPYRKLSEKKRAYYLENNKEILRLLWNLKQKLRWRNTSKKIAPKELHLKQLNKRNHDQHSTVDE